MDTVSQAAQKISIDTVAPIDTVSAIDTDASLKVGTVETSLREKPDTAAVSDTLIAPIKPDADTISALPMAPVIPPPADTVKSKRTVKEDTVMHLVPAEEISETIVDTTPQKLPDAGSKMLSPKRKVTILKHWLTRQRRPR